MILLIVPTTSAPLTLKMPTMMVALLNLLIQAVTTDLHAQWTLVDLKDANKSSITLLVMMDLHALKMLAHLEAKVRMKMDVYLLLILLIVKIALSAHQMYVPQEVKMQTAMVAYLPKLIPDAMMDLHAL